MAFLYVFEEKQLRFYVGLEGHIKPLQTHINLNHIHGFRIYCAVNTLFLDYKI
jgi:hypothetical protein